MVRQDTEERQRAGTGRGSIGESCGLVGGGLVGGEDGTLSTGSFGEDRNISWSRSGISEDGRDVTYSHRPDDWNWRTNGEAGSGSRDSGSGGGDGQEYEWSYDFEGTDPKDLRRLEGGMNGEVETVTEEEAMRYCGRFMSGRRHQPHGNG